VKKIIFVMTTVLAMLVFMAFTCYGQGIDACYQKNDGQLRILTHNKDCDKGHNKDCDKDGYTNKCKPSEIAITLQGGGEIPEVPQTCAGTVCYDDNTSLGPCTQSFVSSCATHNRTGTGLYTITFNPAFGQKPACVFYVQPDFDYVIIQLVQTSVDASYNISIYTFAPADTMAPVDSRFNFICTEP
jgi:hypothetical protein